MVDAVVIPCCGNSYCDDCKFFSLWLNNNARLKVSSFKRIYCKHFIYSSRHWAIAMIYAALNGGNVGVKVAMVEKSELCYNQREECKKSTDKINKVRGAQEWLFFFL